MHVLEGLLSAFAAVDWQTTANVATAIAVVVGLATLVWEVRQTRRAQKFTVFLRFVDAYESLQEQRQANWRRLKDAVRASPTITAEIGDKTSSLDYLTHRVTQAEPLFAIEHGVLEYEIRSLNLLNELCRYAADDPHKMLLMKTLLASELSYYQNRLPDLLYIRTHEAGVRLLSVPRADALQKFSIGDFFQEPLRDP